jgi:hypothetical protein
MREPKILGIELRRLLSHKVRAADQRNKLSDIINSASSFQTQSPTVSRRHSGRYAPSPRITPAVTQRSAPCINDSNLFLPILASGQQSLVPSAKDLLVNPEADPTRRSRAMTRGSRDVRLPASRHLTFKSRRPS